MEEVRRKSQTYFFSKLLPWATTLKVMFSGKLKFRPVITKNDLFEQNIIIAICHLLFRMHDMDKHLSCTFEH